MAARRMQNLMAVFMPLLAWMLSYCTGVTSSVYEIHDAIIIEADGAGDDQVVNNGPASYSTLTANVPNVLAYGSAPTFPWLLNDAQGRVSIKDTNEMSKIFGVLATCGAGPEKLLTLDDQRIVGGIDAVKNSWPGMAGLSYDGDFLCGGSLIGPTKILTAAHCFESLSALNMQLLIVDLGMHDRNTNDAQVSRNVRRIAIHIGWDPATVANDIAMLTLDSPVTYTPTISPFCLPSPGFADLYVDRAAAIIGWGDLQQGGPSSAVLQQATVQVESNSNCRDIYGLDIIKSTLCAAAPGIDTCQGDSGGPLLVRSSTDKRWTLAGITSFGFGCAVPGIPGVYTRVSSYRAWIKFHLLF